MKQRIVVASLMLFAASVAKGQVVKRAYCNDDGKLHVVYENGIADTVSSEPGQVGCDGIEIANDGYTVGWEVLIDNCCTSYPIPTEVVVLRNGKKTVIPSDQMVWKWRFVNRGAQIAILSGPVHGEAAAATLYDASDAKRLASWNGSGGTPQWAQGWEQEFQP